MSKKNQTSEIAPPPPSTAPEGLMSRVAKAIAGPKKCMVQVGELYLTHGNQAGFKYEGKVFDFEADAKKAFGEWASKNASWKGEPEYLGVDE